MTWKPDDKKLPGNKPGSFQLTNLGKVEQFHKKFGHPVNTKPTIPSVELRRLRIQLLAEELQELAKASGVEFSYDIAGVSDSVNDIDIVGVADALADIEYVTHGAALTWGIPSQQVFDEVHRSNMSKLGRDGKPVLREDGKVLKGPDYTPPNIAKIIKEVK